MIPYLQHCYSGKNIKSNLEQCLNNLHRDGLDHKLVEVEICVLGQLHRLRSNMTISERDEPYQHVNIMHPLLKSIPLYQSLLQEKEALFQKCLFAKVARSGLFWNLMMLWYLLLSQLSIIWGHLIIVKNFSWDYGWITVGRRRSSPPAALPQPPPPPGTHPHL